MKFDIKSSQRGPRIEAFRLTPASVPTTITAGTTTSCPEGFAQCSVTKNGTGDFTVTLNKPFKRLPIATASALHATTKLFTTLVSVSTSTARFACFTDAGTATDPTSLHVSMIGFDTVDSI